MYSPTPKQKRQDNQLRNALLALKEASCLESKMEKMTCSMNGGRRTRRTAAKKPAKKKTVTASAPSRGRRGRRAPAPRSPSMPPFTPPEASVAEAAPEEKSNSNNNKSQTSKNKKPTPIKLKARRHCDDEENWGEYLRLAQVLLVACSVGVVATGIASTFFGYADSMMETMGYGSMNKACSSGNYLPMQFASTFVPGMDDCATITDRYSKFMLGAWGSLVALAAAFKANLPGSVSETPSVMVEMLAKTLCRYFKERELHEELMQRLANANKNNGLTPEQVDARIKEALSQVGSSSASASTTPTSRSGTAGPAAVHNSPIAQPSPSSVNMQGRAQTPELITPPGVSGYMPDTPPGVSGYMPEQVEEKYESPPAAAGPAVRRSTRKRAPAAAASSSESSSEESGSSEEESSSDEGGKNKKHKSRKKAVKKHHKKMTRKKHHKKKHHKKKHKKVAKKHHTKNKTHKNKRKRLK